MIDTSEKNIIFCGSNYIFLSLIIGFSCSPDPNTFPSEGTRPWTLIPHTFHEPSKVDHLRSIDDLGYSYDLGHLHMFLRFVD